jgi:hypothetical protein
VSLSGKFFSFSDMEGSCATVTHVTCCALSILIYFTLDLVVRKLVLHQTFFKVAFECVSKCDEYGSGIYFKRSIEIEIGSAPSKSTLLCVKNIRDGNAQSAI